MTATEKPAEMWMIELRLKRDLAPEKIYEVDFVRSLILMWMSTRRDLNVPTMDNFRWYMEKGDACRRIKFFGKTALSVSDAKSALTQLARLLVIGLGQNRVDFWLDGEQFWTMHREEPSATASSEEVPRQVH